MRNTQLSADGCFTFTRPAEVNVAWVDACPSKELVMVEPNKRSAGSIQTSLRDGMNVKGIKAINQLADSFPHSGCGWCGD